MAISFVNGNNNGGFSSTMTLGSIVLTNLLVIWGRFNGVGSAPTLASSNAFTLGPDFTNGGSRCSAWYCLSATATSESITFTGAGSFPEIVIQQFNTSVGAWSYGGSPVTGTASFTSPTWTGGAKTIVVGDLVLGFWENESTNGITFSTSGVWNYRSVNSQGNAVMSDHVATSTSETPAIGANSNAATGGFSTVNFRASGAAVAAKPVVIIMQ